MDRLDITQISFLGVPCIVGILPLCRKKSLSKLCECYGTFLVLCGMPRNPTSRQAWISFFLPHPLDLRACACSWCPRLHVSTVLQTGGVLLLRIVAYIFNSAFRAQFIISITALTTHFKFRFVHPLAEPCLLSSVYLIDHPFASPNPTAI